MSQPTNVEGQNGFGQVEIAFFCLHQLDSSDNLSIKHLEIVRPSSIFLWASEAKAEELRAKDRRQNMIIFACLIDCLPQHTDNPLKPIPYLILNLSSLIVGGKNSVYRAQLFCRQDHQSASIPVPKKTFEAAIIIATTSFHPYLPGIIYIIDICPSASLSSHHGLALSL